MGVGIGEMNNSLLLMLFWRCQVNFQVELHRKWLAVWVRILGQSTLYWFSKYLSKGLYCSHGSRWDLILRGHSARGLDVELSCGGRVRTGGARTNHRRKVLQENVNSASFWTRTKEDDWQMNSSIRLSRELCQWRDGIAHHLGNCVLFYLKNTGTSSLFWQSEEKYPVKKRDVWSLPGEGETGAMGNNHWWKRFWMLRLTVEARTQ